MKPKDRLFPGLATKKLYRMIQLDLRDAGIPYQTEEGIADFHAAGRHTYITQLIRSGVSLPTAMELARHSDVKMTMRYTHIGIADQAAALASLPAAPQPVTPGSALHGRCISGGGGCHNGAESDIGVSVPKKEKVNIRRSSENGRVAVPCGCLQRELRGLSTGIGTPPLCRDLVGSYDELETVSPYGLRSSARRSSERFQGKKFAGSLGA
jgi:hypothetical protein